MVDDYSFNKFCELLSDEAILKTSTAFGVAKQFQNYIADIKSQVLKELMNRTENQDVYLDFLINEIEKQEYVKDAGLNYIERWLKEYDTTIEKVLEHSNYKSPIYTVLDRHYDDMEPFSEEKDKAHLVQTDFLNYFCSLYANELVEFLESKKPKPNTQAVIPPTNNKPFKDEYLIAFCKEISNERAIKETSFMQLYDYGITHYGPYLESEITENLLLLDKDKKEDYLNYVLDKISKTPYANIPEDFIDKWLKEYNADISEFPNFTNKKLNEDLETYYQGLHHTTHQEQHHLLSIQIDFYCYPAMLEVKKIVAFIETKSGKQKETPLTVKQENSKQLTVNQIVLLLQEIGFFNHPKIENASKVKQSELISSLTGLNDKNIKTAIQKLDKKPSELGENYQKDIDKIGYVLDNLL
mgnify:CR=1 FL=1